ncbi:MAG: MBL fold metallo-hydrolase [Christensenellaceae bacterium]
MKKTVTLIANAGILLQINGKKILVDALHNRYTQRFSSVDDALLEQICIGNPPFDEVDFLIFTHDHPDHYSKRHTAEFLKNNKHTRMISPIDDFEGIKGVHVLKTTHRNYEYDGIKITCRKLLHDGEEYAEIVNYGFVLDIDGFCIAFFGDSTFDKQSIAELIGGRHINAAIVNFPYITLRRGLECVKEAIKPDELVVFHLPFADKDAFSYVDASKRAAGKLTEIKTTLLLERMQTVQIGK